MRRALLLATLTVTTRAQSETVPLFNAAAPGQTMPAVGLGTGGYGATHNAYNACACWARRAAISHLWEIPGEGGWSHLFRPLPLPLPLTRHPAPPPRRVDPECWMEIACVGRRRASGPLARRGARKPPRTAPPFSSNK